MASSKKAVAPAPAQQAPKPPVVYGTMAKADLPDYIQQGDNRGNEDVGIGDVIIPRLELIQALSPCLKESDAAHIEGSKQGMLFNSVTRELYGSAVVVCPVYYRKEYLVWKDRKKGGGFRGSYPTEMEARERIRQEEDAKFFDVVPTDQHFCLRLNDADGTLEEIVISMAKTKLKVSRNWNALIRMGGPIARFSKIYTMTTVEDSNDKGEYHNLAVAPIGFSPVEVYRRAEALYESINSGSARVVADNAFDENETLEEGRDY